MKYTLTSPPEPGAMILHCPMCGVEVHRVSQDDLRERLIVATESERAIEFHLIARHPRRYRLYERTGWTWILRGFALGG